MPTFSPPTRKQSMGNAFWQRYSMDVGVSLVKVAGHYVELPGPTTDELTGVEGVDFFIGGHEYDVSADVLAALASDGFAEVPESSGFGLGAYGAGPYGG